MKTNYTFTLSILMALLFTQACTKERNNCVDNNYYRYQTERDLGFIPYTDSSVITFINKTSRDTQVFEAQGYKFDWGKYVTQEECPQTYNLQRRYIVFQCTKNTDRIIIENTFKEYYARTITFSYKRNGLSTLLDYTYNYDSLEIENKYYYKISLIENDNRFTGLRMLYSNANGIIQLVHPPTNDTLNLINLKL